MGFLGGPTDRVGGLFNFFMHPLSKLCMHMPPNDFHTHEKMLIFHTFAEIHMPSD